MDFYSLQNLYAQPVLRVPCEYYWTTSPRSNVEMDLLEERDECDMETSCRSSSFLSASCFSSCGGFSGCVRWGPSCDPSREPATPERYCWMSNDPSHILHSLSHFLKTMKVFVFMWKNPESSDLLRSAHLVWTPGNTDVNFMYLSGSVGLGADVSVGSYLTALGVCWIRLWLYGVVLFYVGPPRKRHDASQASLFED